MSIHSIKFRNDQIFFSGNLEINDCKILSSVFYFNLKDLFKKIKPKRTENKFTGQSDNCFDVIAKGNNTWVVGIDSLSNNYVIIENILTKEVIISGHVPLDLNTLTYHRESDSVWMAGASNGVSSFRFADPEEIIEEYFSQFFGEIYLMRLIKNQQFLCLSGDKEILEIFEIKTRQRVRIVQLRSDVYLFKQLGKQLYFYDDQVEITQSIDC